jgi:TonB family protein
VKEYYKTSDILLANLTTTSNKDILETGGMLHIEAFYNGEKCKLKKEATIEIAFPTKDKKDDMQLFSGSWSSDKINWTLQATKIDEKKETTVFSVVETMAEFPGGQQKLMEYLSENIKYPRTAKENGIQGTVYIGFIVNENGEIENIRVLRGVAPSLNQAAISVVEHMPKWTPGKKRGENVKVNMEIPIRFSLGEESSNINNIEYAKEFEKKVNDNNLSETKVSEISQYLFCTSKLGWINCDRFYKDNNPKVNYFVNIGKSQQVDIKIIFNNIRSILAGSIRDNKYIFENVPSGHSVTIVALIYENDQYYLAIKKTKINSDGEMSLEFEPVTITRLKTEMEKLNRI